MKNFVLIAVPALLLFLCSQQAAKEEAQNNVGGIPFHLPKEKPNRAMSAAMERIQSMNKQVLKNELIK